MESTGRTGLKVLWVLKVLPERKGLKVRPERRAPLERQVPPDPAVLKALPVLKVPKDPRARRDPKELPGLLVLKVRRGCRGPPEPRVHRGLRERRARCFVCLTRPALRSESSSMEVPRGR